MSISFPKVRPFTFRKPILKQHFLLYVSYSHDCLKSQVKASFRMTLYSGCGQTGMCEHSVITHFTVLNEKATYTLQRGKEASVGGGSNRGKQGLYSAWVSTKSLICLCQ